MDLVHVWYDDRYLSRILRCTIPTPVHDHKVKVKDWFFMFFYNVGFAKHLMDFIPIWQDVRYWSKILHGTIPIPGHDLKIKVTDLDFLC